MMHNLLTTLFDRKVVGRGIGGRGKVPGEAAASSGALTPPADSPSADELAPSAEQEHLVAILDEYLRGIERGEPITPDDLFARHPELADQLREYLGGLKIFHQAAARLPQPAAWISTGPAGPELSGELGDFRLLREIGRGGMGIVYEAVQISLGRHVALKVLPFSAAIDERQITRFKNEAQA